MRLMNKRKEQPFIIKVKSSQRDDVSVVAMEWSEGVRCSQRLILISSLIKSPHQSRRLSLNLDSLVTINDRYCLNLS